MKQILHTPDAPLPIGPYSQAVKAGPFLFVSGQICIDPETTEMRNKSLEEETRQVMTNIGAILHSAGMSYGNIVKSSIFLANMDDFALINQIYGSYFSAEHPARETVEVSRLPKDVRVEISVVAYNVEG